MVASYHEDRYAVWKTEGILVQKMGQQSLSKRSKLATGFQEKYGRQEYAIKSNDATQRHRHVENTEGCREVFRMVKEDPDVVEKVIPYRCTVSDAVSGPIIYRELKLFDSVLVSRNRLR